MGFYNHFVLPRVIDLAMGNKLLGPYRERLISAAEGRVLEIGVGSGFNLPLYRSPVTEIIALEPDTTLTKMAKQKAAGATRTITFLNSCAEQIPMDDKSVDTVVSAWTMCTIPELSLALHEMRRVLRPGGRLLFVEHGLAPEPSVQKWQHRVAPIWKRLAGGCRPDRPIKSMIEEGGFRIDRIETGYLRGRSPMAFLYEGSASPA